MTFAKAAIFQPSFTLFVHPPPFIAGKIHHHPTVSFSANIVKASLIFHVTNKVDTHILRFFNASPSAAANAVESAIAVAADVGYHLISGETLPKIEPVVISVKMEKNRDPIIQSTINFSNIPSLMTRPTRMRRWYRSGEKERRSLTLMMLR